LSDEEGEEEVGTAGEEAPPTAMDAEMDALGTLAVGGPPKEGEDGVAETVDGTGSGGEEENGAEREAEELRLLGSGRNCLSSVCVDDADESYEKELTAADTLVSVREIVLWFFLLCV
jgi:hypothetical protein